MLPGSIAAGLCTTTVRSANRSGTRGCEDVHSSYLPSFGEGTNGAAHEGSFMAYAKGLLDELHAWFSEGARPTDVTLSTASIHIYPGMVVVEREPRGEPRVIGTLGERQELSTPISTARSLWERRS